MRPSFRTLCWLPAILALLAPVLVPAAQQSKDDEKTSRGMVALPRVRIVPRPEKPVAQKACPGYPLRSEPARLRPLTPTQAPNPKLPNADSCFFPLLFPLPGYISAYIFGW